MIPQYENPIPLDEWAGHLPRLLSPLKPGEFDLTPVLRARYGNQLREGIVSIRLFAEDRNLVLHIEEVGSAVPLLVPFAEVLIVPETDPVSLTDHFFARLPHDAPDRYAPEEPRREWLLALLPLMLETFDAVEVARDLNLFTPQYLALLARLEMRKHLDQEPLFDEMARHRRGVAFFRNCTKRLALHFHSDIREQLIHELATRLKRQPAFEVLSSELKTYWDEIGVIAEEGSDNLLYWTLMRELDALAANAIQVLPAEERFALWASREEAGDWFDNYADEDYPTKMGDENIDLDALAADIRNALLGEAMDTLSPEARDYLGY